MALRRKVHEHRLALESGRLQRAVIPYNTWRRWLDQGKITEEELLEIGINPGRKRQRRKRQEGGHRVVLHATTPTSASISAASSSTSQMFDSAESQSGSSLVQDIDVFSEGGGTDSDGSLLNWLSNDSDHSQNRSFDLEKSDSSEGTRSDSDDDRITAVLESKKIGVEALNKPLTTGSKFTKFEAMLMIFHLTMRHGLTDVFLEDQIAFVNEILGDPHAIPGSKFLFQKLFMFGSKPTVHFFCPPCDIYLGPRGIFDQQVTCDDCDWHSSVSSLNNNNYFVTLSIRDQLREVLSRPNCKLVSRNNLGGDFISDMYHGKIYKKLMRNGGPLSNENALTISLSTDGSPVFKNGPNTLYPIHFHLNEIVPEERFDVENMLLAGLWFSKKGDPNLQIFLKPVVDELLALEKDGIIWRKSCGTVVKSPVYLTSVCADSVARPKIQNFSLFASSYGCSYCMHPNISTRVSVPVKGKEGIKVSSVLRTNDALSDESDIDEHEVEQPQLIREKQIKRYLAGNDYPLRTDKSLREHLQLAARSNLEHIYGAKGECVLSPLRCLNLVFGVPIDYLHAILLGVVKRLAGLWFDQKSTGKPYYIGLKIEIVNRRLLQIIPPSNVMKPRSMSVRSFWKAKEWRSFLLYYGLPCLKGVLPEAYFNHFKKLSTAIFILSKETIMFDEGNEAELLLKEYVQENQNLYGDANMVFNTHLVCHLGKQVASLGPLWAYSLFPFEAGNGRLVKLVKGTMGVATQIAHKYLMTHTVSKLLRAGTYTVQDSVLDFCCKVVEYRYLKNSSKCSRTRLLGRPRLVQLSEEQKQAFAMRGIDTSPKFFQVFNRAVLKKVTYSSRQMGRQKTANDSCVRLQDGSFAMIDLIVSLRDDEDAEAVVCVARQLNIAVDGVFEMPPNVKQCAIDPYGPVLAFSLEDVKARCMFISFDDHNYVAEFPNRFEKS